MNALYIYIYIHKVIRESILKEKRPKEIFFSVDVMKKIFIHLKNKDFSRKILLFSLFTPPVTNRSKGVHARNK